jgi:hypothetical protein
MAIPQFTAGQVLTAAELNAMVDAINAGGAVQVTRFTASGTFTVPAGVTYAVAHITAGGGGVGSSGAGAGGTSSVAFAGGTVSATGGVASNNEDATTNRSSMAGPANSGSGASGVAFQTAGGGPTIVYTKAQNGAYIVAGGAVTPAASITVTVGAGGTAGTGGGLSAAGGSGYVYIEYSGAA